MNPWLGRIWRIQIDSRITPIVLAAKSRHNFSVYDSMYSIYSPFQQSKLPISLFRSIRGRSCL
ncbi:MAG: hypothetical protein CMJ77_00295 [Planctomycetaceae bacterium]|nr:hypothetical protein [Planctomycetaceae bacterium]